MTPHPARLGVIAGGGQAPRRLLDAAKRLGRDVFLICLEGQSDPDLGEGRAHVWLPLGAVGRACAALREAGVQDVVMIGAVRRPSLRELKTDFFTLQKLTRAGFGLLGDDGALRVVARIFEDEGFHVVGVQDVMRELLTPAGVIGTYGPDDGARADIRRGIAVARALGSVDVGQSVVVQQGLVLALEAIEGTDAMIARSAALAREGLGGVLVKACKPQQDRRLDLPSWGPSTVRAAAQAGLRGIAVQAGASLLIDRAEVCAIADEAGLFLFGFEGDTA